MLSFFFLTKNSSAICKRFMAQCTTKDAKESGGRDTNMHQREKKWMRLHTQQDGYSFLLRSACTFRIWLWNMHVHGYFHKGRVTTQYRSKTATFFPVWMSVTKGIQRPCLQLASQRIPTSWRLAAAHNVCMHTICAFIYAIMKQGNLSQGRALGRMM